MGSWEGILRHWGSAGHGKFQKEFYEYWKKCIDLMMGWMNDWVVELLDYKNCFSAASDEGVTLFIR